MRLTDLPAALVEDLVRTWRRRIIVGVLVVAFALAAIIHGISAIRYALRPLVGPAGADLILVGLFLLIIAGAIAFLIRAERRDAVRKQAADDPKDKKVAVIAEAVSLGYALAQDFRRARAEGASDPAAPGEKTQPASDDPQTRPRATSPQ